MVAAVAPDTGTVPAQSFAGRTSMIFAGSAGAIFQLSTRTVSTDFTRSTTLATAGSIGAVNSVGATPIRMAMAHSGMTVAHSRGRRSCNLAFFGLVTSPRYTRWNIHSM